MILSYRARRILKTAAVVGLLVLLAAAVAWSIWFVWLERFVIYTRDGTVLDFGISQQPGQGEIAVEPEPEETVSIYYDDGSAAIADTELKQLVGYYVDTQMLQTDMSTVREKIKTLPAGTPVMLDVKSIYGSFYYSSAVSQQRNTELDIQGMDQLIKALDESGMYLIARLPAFRDYHYGLHHVSDGLPVSAGYLWMDENYCYWLNPAKEGTMTYLIGIVTELRGLGFDEVVFTDFCFPETDEIVFMADKAQTLATAAQTLVTTCATDTFAVSFAGEDASLSLPVGRSRLYFTGVAAADAAAIAQTTGVENTAVQLVFLTEYHDTRFDVFSVLRPFSSAH